MCNYCTDQRQLAIATTNYCTDVIASRLVTCSHSLPIRISREPASARARVRNPLIPVNLFRFWKALKKKVGPRFLRWMSMLHKQMRRTCFGGPAVERVYGGGNINGNQWDCRRDNPSDLGGDPPSGEAGGLPGRSHRDAIGSGGFGVGHLLGSLGGAFGRLGGAFRHPTFAVDG